ncbi:DNA-processing protein DprA [Gimesia sp.]|uniref:DNA-processing protein DprA n=1 Tax=Gimesia sp. TaxID=2024833 RepID=UPI003A915DD1
MGEPNQESDQSLLELIQLNLIRGVGPRIRRTLLDQFGSPAQILNAPRQELLNVPGIGTKLADAIIYREAKSTAEDELRRCRENGYQILFEDLPEYPSLLREMPDPPSLLYCNGNLLPEDELAVAIVGSRKCTHYGLQQAEKIAAALARAGITIVSGLARGIDQAAHTGALKAGGRTIAVMATGLAHIYPPEHRDLAKDVASQGAIVTEFPLDQAPVAGLFPQRNRIISGFSMGVVLIEAGRKSGALHTARHAYEQGREVFAVPGRIDHPASAGCHDLIRDGAMLVRDVDDILEGLGPAKTPVLTAQNREVHTPRELSLSEFERDVLNLVTLEPQHLNEIVQSSELDSSRILSTLTILEMRKVVKRLPGGFLVRATG